jgi:hypothetical protein
LWSKSTVTDSGAIGAHTSIFSNNTGCDSPAEVLATGNCGNVINDINGDCIWDPDEPRLPRRLAILSPGNIILTSNVAGLFDLSHLQVGQYTLQIDTSGPWTTSCPMVRTFEVLQDGIIPEFEPFCFACCLSLQCADVISRDAFRSPLL